MLALIALANSALYLHGREYGVRQHVTGGSAADEAVGALMVTFVDGRAYPLFAALFGYGLVRLALREPDPASARSVLRRRSGWLVAFGAVHGILLFPGDILGTYGLLGLALAGAWQARDRLLLGVAAVTLPLVALVVGAVYGTRPADPDQRSFLWSMAIDDPMAALAWRPVEWLMTPVAMLGVVPAALVGIVAARRGLLDAPHEHRPLLRRVAVGGIVLAAAGGLPVALAVAHVWEPSPGALFAASALHAVTGVAGGLGYAALLGLMVVNLRPDGPTVRALRITGQQSLTCYLLQSVVFALLLAAWAGGLGAHLGAASVALVGLATWAGTVVLASSRWASGRRGPAEVLLRRLVYRRQPARMGAWR